MNWFGFSGFKQLHLKSVSIRQVIDSPLDHSVIRVQLNCKSINPPQYCVFLVYWIAFDLIEVQCYLWRRRERNCVLWIWIFCFGKLKITCDMNTRTISIAIEHLRVFLVLFWFRSQTHKCTANFQFSSNGKHVMNMWIIDSWVWVCVCIMHEHK